MAVAGPRTPSFSVNLLFVGHTNNFPHQIQLNWKQNPLDVGLQPTSRFQQKLKVEFLLFSILPLDRATAKLFFFHIACKKTAPRYKCSHRYPQFCLQYRKARVLRVKIKQNALFTMVLTPASSWHPTWSQIFDSARKTGSINSFFCRQHLVQHVDVIGFFSKDFKKTISAL